MALSEGYASRAYAESLAGFGEPLHLPHCDGYLLKRRIPGTTDYDAMGCYPLFFCADWSRLADDLAQLHEKTVSVSIVPDPFGPYTQEQLAECFDVVNPFKTHYIADLACAPEKTGTRRHRKAARSAARHVRVEVCRDPAGFLDDWNRLYAHLVRRHGIRGIRAFSAKAFERQLNMPEIVVHQAFIEGEIAGAQLFFVQDGVAHCHLGAVSDAGYAAGAFYALDAFSIDYFAESADKLDFGGGAGLSAGDSDGLSRYKKGWSTETRPVYFCGRIINPGRYADLAARKQCRDTHYFPAYRFGEFG